MDQLGQQKQHLSSQQNLLDGLTSIRLDCNQMNLSSSSINDESYLLESIKNNYLIESQYNLENVKDQDQTIINDQHFSYMIKAIQMEYQPEFTIEEKPEENFSQPNESIKGKSPTKIDQKQNQAIQILKNKIVELNQASQELNFSQFNNIIQEQIKNLQEENHNLDVKMNQTSQDQPIQDGKHFSQAQNTQYLLSKCQEIYDQLQYRNPDVLLQRIPQAQEEYSLPLQNKPQINQNCEIKNNVETISNFSLDSSALINLIPFDSIKNQNSSLGNESHDENSKNKVFNIFNEKQHIYIKEISLNNNNQHIQQENQNFPHSNQKDIQTFYVKYNINGIVQQQFCSLRQNQNIPMEIQQIQNTNQNIPMDIQIIQQGGNNNTNEMQIAELSNIPMQIQEIEYRVSNDQKDQHNLFNDFLNQNNQNNGYNHSDIQPDRLQGSFNPDQTNVQENLVFIREDSHIEQGQIFFDEQNNQRDHPNLSHQQIDTEPQVLQINQSIHIQDNIQFKRQQKAAMGNNEQQKIEQEYIIQMVNCQTQEKIPKAQHKNTYQNIFQLTQNCNNLSLNVQHDNNFVQNLNDFTEIMNNSHKKQPIELFQEVQQMKSNHSVFMIDIGSNKKIQIVYQMNEEMLNKTNGDLFTLERQDINNNENNENQTSLIHILQKQDDFNENKKDQNNYLPNIQQKDYIQIKDNSYNEISKDYFTYQQHFLNDQFNNLRKDVNMQIQSLQKFVHQQKVEIQLFKSQRQRKRQKLATYNIFNINDVISSSHNNNQHLYDHYHKNNYSYQQHMEASNNTLRPHQSMNHFNRHQTYLPNISVNNCEKDHTTINQNMNMQKNMEKVIQKQYVQVKENPRIKINFKNNQISLDIFEGNNLPKTGNNYLQQNISLHESKQLIQVGVGEQQIISAVNFNNKQNPPLQAQRINTSRQTLTQKRQVIKLMNEKEIIMTNLSTDDEQLPQNNPQKQKIINSSIIQSSFQSRQTSENSLENYHSIIKQTENFLLHKDDDKKIVEQFEKILNKHIYLRFTPGPKTSLGQQLFKNGLFLVGMIILITRSSNKAYTIYHVFMHVHNFYGQFIEENKYIYNIELQHVKHRYEEYLNQSYQQLLHKHHAQINNNTQNIKNNNNNLQTIKRKHISQVQQLPYIRIQSVDKINNQQQTTPKKNLMRHQCNLIDEKIVSQQGKKVNSFQKIDKKSQMNGLTYESITSRSSNRIKNLQQKVNRQSQINDQNQMKIEMPKKNNDKISEKRQNFNFTIFDSNNQKIVQKDQEDAINTINKKNSKYQLTPKKPSISTINTINSLSQKLKKFQKKIEENNQKANTPQSNTSSNEQLANLTQNLPENLTQPVEPVNNPARLNDLYQKYRRIRQNRKSNLVNHKNQVVKEEEQKVSPTQKPDQIPEIKRNKKLKHVQFVDLEQNNSQTDDGIDKKKKKGSIGKGQRKREKKDDDYGDNSTEENHGMKKGQLKKKSKK